ncbi:phage tail protein [Orbus mooreae]|uniref:phage tail protein n=1 Tax=Orbus mooreae TaxID=3074107 RepID=UPI00370D7C1F
MLSISIDVDDASVKSLMNELGDKAARIMADSQNRAIAGVRTDGTKLIKSESGIERKVIFKSFTLIKASAKSDNPTAKVIVSGRPVGLIKYPHKPKRIMAGKTRSGVKINVAGKDVHFKHGFVAKMPNGHIGIFERVRGVKTKGGKEKLSEFFGPSVPQLAGRGAIEEKIIKQAQERFINRFNQQANRYLKSKGAK